MAKFYPARSAPRVDVVRFFLLPGTVFLAVLFWPRAIPLPVSLPTWQRGETIASSAVSRFSICASALEATCVIDGDTFRLEGRKIRIADIDTPETHPARCAEEEALGATATYRLAELLSSGPFELESGLRDRDRYGRELRIVRRDGHSLGGVLISEGLARPWEGQRRPWCNT